MKKKRLSFTDAQLLSLYNETHNDDRWMYVWAVENEQDPYQVIARARSLQRKQDEQYLKALLADL